MALDFLSNTRKKLINMSAVLAGATQVSDPQVEMFDARLTELFKMVSALRLDLAKCADSMIASATQSSKTGVEFLEIYRHSEARQKSLVTFSDTMREVESHAAEIWTRQFNYEVLGILDHWKDQLSQLIKRTKTTHKTFVRISQANQSKTESPAALAKMQSDYEQSRNELKEIVKKHLESRYTVLDAVLVRLMELQIEYLNKSASIVSQLEKNVQSYRKRFPKGSVPEILQVQLNTHTDQRTNVSNSEQSNQVAAQSESEDESSEEDDSEDEKNAHADDKPVSKRDAEDVSSKPSSNGRQAEPMTAEPKPSDPVDLLFGFDAGLISSDNNSRNERSIPFEDLAGVSSSALTSATPDSIDHLFSSIPVDTTPLASFPFAADFASASPAAPNDFLYSTAYDAKVPENVPNESNPKIRNLRANLHAEENLKDAKDRAKDNVAFQLDSWEYSLGQKRKNIRILLSTMHTILPPDMNFTPIKISDLQTAANVKKAMRKAVLCVHPDKIDAKSVNGAEKLVICERVFNAIQVEYKAFEDSGAS